MQKKVVALSIRIMLITAMIVAIPAVPISFKTVSMGSAVPDHLLLTWYADSQTTQVITWRMDIGAEDGFVQYVEDLQDFPFPYDVRSVTSSVQKLKTNAGHMSIHSVQLTRLKPGTRYYYRVGYGNIWTGWRPFTTAPAEPKDFTFLIIGNGEQTSSQSWRNFLHQAYQYYPKAAFFIQSGVLVKDEQDYRQWDDWFKAADGVIDTLPILPVGRTVIPGEQRDASGLYDAIFMAAGTKALYSQDYGDVHFTMIHLAAANSQYREYQQLIQELGEDFNRSKKKWKVVVMSENFLSEELSSLFSKYQVDVVIAGNKTVYFRKSTQRISNHSAKYGVASKPDGEHNFWDELRYPTQAEPFFLAVTVAGDVMKLQVVNQHGYPLDHWIIEKCCME